MAVDWRSASTSHRPLLLNEVAVTPSSTTPTEWPGARLAALPGHWVQKCCRGSGYPVFWHRATPLVKPALSTLRASELRSGDGKVLHCANLLIPHLRGNKPTRYLPARAKRRNPGHDESEGSSCGVRTWHAR